MANCTNKHGQLYVDPGGDPATPGLHGQPSSGGFVECLGRGTTTQTSGWRARLVALGVAT